MATLRQTQFIIKTILILSFTLVLIIQQDVGWFSDGTGDNISVSAPDCPDAHNNLNEFAPENGGRRGSWGVSATCPEGSHIIGFKSKVQSSIASKSAGDTALNSIKAKCSDESNTIIESSGGEFGSWATNFAQCTDNSFVCGFKIKVQSDTAMNALQLECCSNQTKKCPGNCSYELVITILTASFRLFQNVISVFTQYTIFYVEYLIQQIGNILTSVCHATKEFIMCTIKNFDNNVSASQCLISSENRNIIFVGRSRAGKSTLIEVLKDKKYNPGKMSIFQGTKNAAVHPFGMRCKECDINLHFNIMDTPGLFEYTRKIDNQRTNQVILDIITKCIDMEITKINHVYFVMSLQNGLNKHDVESFALFTKLFVGMEDKISIILSFTQHIATEEERQHYIKQFQDHPELKAMYDTAQRRIFFLGAAKTDTFSHMEELRENVYKQRDELFKHIVEQTDAFSVTELKVYKEKFSRDSDL